MTKLLTNEKVIVYQGKNGSLVLRGDLKHDTVWATQAQVVSLFGVDQSVVSRHIRNIFADGEILEKGNMQKTHIANSDKPVTLYSLDVILSVGYRTNSKVAIQFRKWATKTLRRHITKGFTVNPKQIQQNYTEFQKVVRDIQSLLPEQIILDPNAVLELVKEFSSTWLSLDAYDKDNLKSVGGSFRSVKLASEELEQAIQSLKQELMKKAEATDIFAQERTEGSVKGIVGNIMQTYAGKPLYSSVESKAAHLLYFMVKNHPFVDGNKRTGAFAFVWFLRKIKLKTFRNINQSALTALTLLIAESNPQKKDLMIGLVIQLLK